MRSVWAVARTTLIECLRTRVLLAFVLLLAGGVLAAGLTFEGDGSLTGRIRTFLYYSVFMTQLLVSLVTVFLSTSIVAGDIRRNTVFTVASKPLRRVHYVLGRWCGIVLLNVLLIGVAMGGIYGMARFLRTTRTRREARLARKQPVAQRADLDRLAIDNEVFAARVQLRPDPIDVEKRVRDEMDVRIQEEGKEKIIRDRIRQKVRDEIGRKGDQDAVIDEREIERRYNNRRIRDEIMDQWRGDLRKRLQEERLLVRPGRGIRLTFSGMDIPPRARETLQMRYRLYPLGTPGSNSVRSIWQLFSPKLGYSPAVRRDDSTEMSSSLRIPAVAKTADGTVIEFIQDGKLTVEYINDDRMPIKLRLEHIALHYRVGGFGGNVVRAGGMILLRQMFLAGIGVLFGVFLSFPIACLVCVIVLLVGVMSGFIAEATRIAAWAGASPTFYDYFSHYLARGVYFFVPALAEVSPADSLVDGASITPAALWKEIARGTGLRTALALAAAAVIFRRRELARVQV